MVRVLFVSHTSDLGCGPVGSLLKLVKYLREDYEISVLAPGSGGLFEVLRRIGVSVHSAGRLGLRFSSIPFLCFLMRKYDLVYGNNFSSGIRNALIAAKLMGKSFLWHIREMFDEDPNPKVVRFLCYADGVVAVSGSCVRKLVRYVPSEKVYLVYNGVDVEDFQVPRWEARGYVEAISGSGGSGRVLNIGRVDSRKGQHYLVDVSLRVLRKFPRVNFLVLGRTDKDPGYVSFVRKRVYDLGLEQCVKFLGLRSDVALFLRGCDIYLHTSSREANSRAVLEAMASGLPVVAFDVDGMNELVVDGETGFLVPYGDVGAMAEVVERLLGDRKLLCEMGSKGFRRVSSLFTAQRVASRVGELISRLV